MKFSETKITGVYLVEPERHADDRGFFARTWCRHEFASYGLNAQFDQCSVSFNRRRGTLRGMHFQFAPHAETKMVRCTAGAIFDVALDLRVDSPTHRQWVSFELTADNRSALYIPPGVAHGFQTLCDNAEVYYQIAGQYSPEHAGGARWNDPAFGIDWPAEVQVIADRDRQYQDYSQ